MLGFLVDKDVRMCLCVLNCAFTTFASLVTDILYVLARYHFIIMTNVCCTTKSKLELRGVDA